MRQRNGGHQAAPPTADQLPAGDHGGGPVPPPSTEEQPPAAQPGTQPAAANPAPTRPAPAHHVVRRTRAGGLWVGLALAAIVLLLLLVFILENQQSASIGYFGAHGRLPLGVALLLAAVAGALLVVIPGSARIMQLRATARRHRNADARAGGSGPQPPPPGEPGGLA